MLTLSAEEERHPAAMHGGENVVGPTEADFQSDRKSSSAMGVEQLAAHQIASHRYLKLRAQRSQYHAMD
jgi:hypothetical protein